MFSVDVTKLVAIFWILVITLAVLRGVRPWWRNRQGWGSRRTWALSLLAGACWFLHGTRFYEGDLPDSLPPGLSINVSDCQLFSIYRLYHTVPVEAVHPEVRPGSGTRVAVGDPVFSGLVVVGHFIRTH